MPVLENKRPIHEKWEQTKKDYDYSNAKAIGLVCGSISGNVEAIDLDLKYDLTGSLFKDYKKAIHEVDPALLNKLVVQKTVSNGYHFIYRCEKIEGNRKLAQRESTTKEKQDTYERTYNHYFKAKAKEESESDHAKHIEDCKSKAEKAAYGDKVRVLLETRGEKGFIACYPTKGYELVYGSFDKIQEITEQQREILFNIAFSFNEVAQKEFKPSIRQEKKQIKGLTPIEDYNDRADVVGLLVKHGWREVGKKGSKILMQRPGDTKADHSGNYDEEKKWFSVFSTSTEFEPQTPYQPYAVYGVLECGKDWNEVPKRLYNEGFGERLETAIENKIEIPSMIDMSDDDYSFLATPNDYDDYLDRWRKGTFEMGKSTGIPELDKYFLFKEGNLVIINGIDNVGKSTVIWFLALMASLKHGWPVLMFSSENHVGTIIRKLIEFYWCEPIATMSDAKYKHAKKYVESNFDFIKVGENLYNYKDWINMMTKALKKKKYKLAIGDPYNSFKIDIPAKSKNSTYDYHYEAASLLQLFGKNNNISIWLNCHVGTVGARNVDKEGFTLAPQKQDTEMGVMFANKADDFLTIHRITQHETEWMMTEIHVRKIKETETGGKVTPKFKPFKMKMVKGLCGFTHFDYNPIVKWHEAQKAAGGTKPLNFTEPLKDQEPEFTTTSDTEEPPF